MNHRDYDCLSEFLSRWGYNNAQLCAAWLSRSRTVGYRKAEAFLHAGEASRNFGLIKSGIVRYYYSNADGKIWNKAFYAEGETVSAASAALTDQPAPFTIEALEPTEIITLPIADLHTLRGEFAELTGLIAQLVINAFIRNEQREAMLLTKNAEQRYQWLASLEPHLLKRVPQFHLASYLGIDAVSLSRVKRKLNL